MRTHKHTIPHSLVALRFYTASCQSVQGSFGLASFFISKTGLRLISPSPTFVAYSTLKLTSCHAHGAAEVHTYTNSNRCVAEGVGQISISFQYCHGFRNQ